MEDNNANVDPQATTAEADTTAHQDDNSTAPHTPNPTADTEQVQEQQGDQGDKQETFDREYVEKLRAENAKYRTKAKETAEAKDAERDQLIQQIGKALGFVDDTPEDPTKLIEAATAERDQLAAQLRQYKVNDAIRNAAPTGTDIPLLTALLNSNNSLSELDLSSDDYHAQVAQAVTTALDTHPNLRTQVVPQASGVDPTNTNSGTERKLTRDDLKNMSADEISHAMETGKLNHLLNGGS